MSKYGIVEKEDAEMMIESSKKGLHRTLEGEMVKIGSPECRTDILRRMDDVGYSRNDHGYGSDARSYFSGILKVLRRKLRENDKIAAESNQQLEVLDELDSEKEEENKSIDEHAADRILKLAGLIN